MKLNNPMHKQILNRFQELNDAIARDRNKNSFQKLTLFKSVIGARIQKFRQRAIPALPEEVVDLRLLVVL